MLAIPRYPPNPVMPAWVGGYIGIPYKLGGRTHSAADCWGLAMLVLIEALKVENAPLFTGVEWSIKSPGDKRRAIGEFIDRASSTLFDPVMPGMEVVGDIIVLRVSGNPLHVGIVVAPGAMLHTDEDADSALERYDGPMWGRRVMGFHRLRGGANERVLGGAWGAGGFAA